VLARAYTYTELGNGGLTQSDDPFLLGPLSQIFTAAAVQVAIEARVLKGTDSAYTLLGYTRTPTDTRMGSITVENLVEHRSGFTGPSILYQMRNIAKTYQNASLPVLARWLAEAGPRLSGTPGIKREESPQNYVLLTQVLETVAKSSLADFLRNQEALKAWAVQAWPTLRSAHKADKVRQESSRVGLDVLRPRDDNAFAAWVYGGDGMLKESAVGAAALAASASTVATILGVHGTSSRGLPRAKIPSALRSESWLTCDMAAVVGLGPRVVGVKSGSIPGARAYAESRKSDSLDWVLLLNTDEVPDEAFGKLTKFINTFLDTNPLT